MRRTNPQSQQARRQDHCGPGGEPHNPRVSHAHILGDLLPRSKMLTGPETSPVLVRILHLPLNLEVHLQCVRHNDTVVAVRATAGP